MFQTPWCHPHPARQFENPLRDTWLCLWWRSCKHWILFWSLAPSNIFCEADPDWTGLTVTKIMKVHFWAAQYYCIINSCWRYQLPEAQVLAAKRIEYTFIDHETYCFPQSFRVNKKRKPRFIYVLQVRLKCRQISLLSIFLILVLNVWDKCNCFFNVNTHWPGNNAFLCWNLPSYYFTMKTNQLTVLLTVLNSQSDYEQILYKHHWEIPLRKKIIPTLTCPILVLLYLQTWAMFFVLSLSSAETQMSTRYSLLRSLSSLKVYRRSNSVSFQLESVIGHPPRCSWSSWIGWIPSSSILSVREPKWMVYHHLPHKAWVHYKLG